MEAKHTKGPWRAMKRERIGNAEWQVAWSDDDELVCDVVYEETDARLIAAAPELLAALRSCASVCAGFTTHKQGLIDALEKANAVIKKATGERL